MVVYKYKLNIPEREALGLVNLPTDAKILKIAEQYGDYYAWCLVDENQQSMAEYQFLVVGTGHTFPEDVLPGMEYVDTVITHSGRLVLHFWIDV